MIAITPRPQTDQAPRPKNLLEIISDENLTRETLEEAALAVYKRTGHFKYQPRGNIEVSTPQTYSELYIPHYLNATKEQVQAALAHLVYLAQNKDMPAEWYAGNPEALRPLQNPVPGQTVVAMRGMRRTDKYVQNRSFVRPQVNGCPLFTTETALEYAAVLLGREIPKKLGGASSQQIEQDHVYTITHVSGDLISIDPTPSGTLRLFRKDHFMGFEQLRTVKRKANKYFPTPNPAINH